MDWATLAGYWPFVLGLMVTGVASGVAAGLLGIGGGAIIVPALSNALLLMGYDAEVVQHVAVGTSLAIIIPTGIMSARAHYKRGALDLKVLRLWAPFIVAGTFRLTGRPLSTICSTSSLKAASYLRRLTVNGFSFILIC